MYPAIYVVSLTLLINHGLPTAIDDDIPRGENKATFYRGTGISKVAGYVLSLAGQQAWLKLLHNSRRTTPGFAKPQRYQKSGDFDVALQQFMDLNPHNVNMEKSAEGIVTSVYGRVGDRVLSLKRTRPGQTGEAVLTMKVDKANYNQPKQLDKITYMGQKKIKYNMWWLAD